MTTVLSRFDRKKLFLILTVAILTVTSLVFTFLVFPNVKTYLEVAKKETSLSQTTDNGGHMEKQLNQLRQEIEQLQSEFFHVAS